MNEVVYKEMIKYYNGDARRIQHFTKVNAYCMLLGKMEDMDRNMLNILDIASLVHDIGIKKSEELYGKGNCGGKYQEKLGPDIARNMLIQLNYPKDVVDRVCFLVGHHHTYSNIDNLDYQILVEADFLVNMYENKIPISNIETAYNSIFRTKSGKTICKNMFGLN